ncbi:MAG: aminoacyl-histidine dipeptidase, partial [Bacteroidota bacterium]|nr:aminoacyl-histidine dipeptidase [Bacteroidota bacterium]
APASVWGYFEEICQVPRPSKKEEKIVAFLLDFAKKHNLDAKSDAVGNVVIRKPASPGKENAPTVVLQSHVDMVCEKNRETVHDFEKDPIRPYIDGEWVTAEGTTLGADDGIGIAAELAVLTDDTLVHGPVECLFTVDEETGLTGAEAIQPGFISGKILLNLDSEDEGELFIGCCGGIDTIARFTYQPAGIPEGTFALKASVKGLQGGHSGDDIHRGRGNANKILNRILWRIDAKYEMWLADFNGGNLRNAIPREAEAVFLVPNKFKENVTADFNVFRSEVEAELSLTDPGFKLTLESTEMPESVIDQSTKTKLLNALYACPHGVIAMSFRMPGMVETSTNLASVKFLDNNIIEVTTSQRSDLDSSKCDVKDMVSSVFTLIGANVKSGDGYPGWTPNPQSEIMNITKSAYSRLFGVEPIVRSIHAGLECGLFLQKYPALDMISFGPTLRGVHSPDEKIEIKSVQKFWDLLAEVLKTLSEK